MFLHFFQFTEFGKQLIPIGGEFIWLLQPDNVKAIIKPAPRCVFIPFFSTLGLNHLQDVIVLICSFKAIVLICSFKAIVLWLINAVEYYLVCFFFND